MESPALDLTFSLSPVVKENKKEWVRGTTIGVVSLVGERVENPSYKSQKLLS